MNKNRIIVVLFLCMFFGFTNRSLSGQPLGNYLVAHYKMNDNAPNSTVIDSSGNGHHGTAYRNSDELNTAELYTEGKIGGALRCGYYDHINIPASPDFPSGNPPISISFWSHARHDEDEGTVIVYGDEGADIEIRVLDYMSSFYFIIGSWDVVPVPIIYAWGDDIPFGGGILPNTAWVNITVTYDGDYFKLYKNGTLRNTYIRGQDFLTPNITLNEGIQIGRDIQRVGPPREEGRILVDNVMIFNKALSQDEIDLLYNSGNGLEDVPYIISGQVTLYGGSADVADVNLNLSGDADIDMNPDADGNYSFTGRSEMGDYIVTPSLEDYYFFPISYSYTSLDSDQTEQDFIGLYGSSSDREGENRCFLTTLFGLAMAKDEDSVLCNVREFRDTYLLANPVGRGFVNTYYKMSPLMTGFISEHPILKSIIRKTLTPLIWMSEKTINHKL